MTQRSFLSPRRVPRSRQGLTLMELVVVMFILVALASIMIPLFPSLVERAHRSSQGTNASEVTKAIQLYQSIYGTYPDGMDLLSDGNTLINYLPAVPTASPNPLGETIAATYPSGNNVNPTFTFASGGYLFSQKLTPAQLATLNGANIIAEYPLLAQAPAPNPNGNGPAGFNWTPTFNPYSSTGTVPQPISLAANTTVCGVMPSGVLVAGLSSPSSAKTTTTTTGTGGTATATTAYTPSTTQFVMFGLGRYCQAIGTVINNAPNNFPNDAVHENPNLVYERFGLVFQLEDQTGAPLPAAIFIGAVAIEGNLILGTDKVMESYYQNIPQQSSPAAGPGE